MRKSIVYTLIACLLVSSLPFSVTADATDDIPTNAAGTGIHDSLVAALTQADLVTTLQGTGPFTVFAPTDQAFIDAGIDLTTFDTDEENATLVDILTYHVVSGKVMSTDLTDGMEASALNQDTLTFSVSSTEVKVNDAVVTLADVESSNGVIHVIDKVLMPPADPVLVDIPDNSTINRSSHCIGCSTQLKQTSLKPSKVKAHSRSLLQLMHAFDSRRY